MAMVAKAFEQPPLSGRYAEALRTWLPYRVVTLPPATSPETMLARGRARAAVIIPEHFEREIRRHRPVEAQVLVDATDGNTAQLIRGSAGQITRAFAQPLGGAAVPAIQTATRLWVNPRPEPRKIYGPGLPVLGLSITRKRSEEHTSELQSQSNLVCRLLLEKKKKKNIEIHSSRHIHDT